ncbi:MAG: hypothetical protein HQL37_03840 [Alphaproteobacteria bacterium]|nr:hypothetical protein [Alphaproteobacteria bacterium]
MSESLNLEGIPEDELGRFLEFREKVVGSNISDKTLLATDYLNHFNEIIMLLEMVADMPEILEECRAWQPKDYCSHFQDSAFSSKDLAIAAYDCVPTKFRRPFEETIDQINRLIAQSLELLDAAVATGEVEIIQMRARACSRGVQKLMDVAGAIIHGSDMTMQQDEIDALLGV